MSNPNDISTPKPKPWSKTVTAKSLAKQYGIHFAKIRRQGGAKRILAIPDEAARRIILGIK